MGARLGGEVPKKDKNSLTKPARLLLIFSVATAIGLIPLAMVDKTYGDRIQHDRSEIAQNDDNKGASEKYSAQLAYNIRKESNSRNWTGADFATSLVIDTSILPGLIDTRKPQSSTIDSGKSSPTSS